MPLRPDVQIRPPDGQTRVFLGAFAAVVATAAGYLADPHTQGEVLRAWVTAALMLAITLGPIVRRARPRRVWLAATVGGAFLFLTSFEHLVEFDLGPLGWVDSVFLLAYGCLIVWLSLLAREGERNDARNAAIDAAATPIGTALAFWVTILAPQSRESLPAVIVWAAYPMLDIVLLSLSVHLAMRLGAVPPPLAWFIASVLLWFVIDTVYAVAAALAPGAHLHDLEAAYLFAHFGLAVALTHRRVPELVPPPITDATRRRMSRLAPLVLFTLSPTALAAAIPEAGPVDSAVRTVLTVALLALLYVRLSRSMSTVQRAEAESSLRATHDALTGLLNRAALVERLDEKLAHGSRHGQSTAVLFVDCDNFKSVNDTWGHHAGDALLTAIAARLPGLLDPSDLVARHGGDEFVIAAAVDQAADAARLAERVRESFAEPVALRPDLRHRVTPSIGIAVARPGDGSSTADLLRRADVAMYEAKRAGRGRLVEFDEEMGRRARTKSSLGARLGEAIRAGAIELHLQPVMSGAGYHRLVGWEALARWRDPVEGDVPPNVFVEAAEELGLIVELGQLVLTRACADLVRLREASPEQNLTISVNVSPAQLMQPGFATTVERVLGATGLPAGALRLEVTETMVVQEGSVALDALREIREGGVHVWLDDFGTGYASLATLRRLPVDGVKLDRSFTAGVGEDLVAWRQLRAVIELVHSLGIADVVAEGVETPQQAAALGELGCSMVQGWLYGRARPTDEVLADLAARADPV